MGLIIPASALTRRDGQDLCNGSGLSDSMCRDHLPASWIGFPDFGECPKSGIGHGPKIRDLGLLPKASKTNRPFRAANGLIFRTRFARAPSGPVLCNGLAPSGPMCQNRTRAKFRIFGHGPFIGHGPALFIRCGPQGGLPRLGQRPQGRPEGHKSLRARSQVRAFMFYGPKC